MSLPCKWVVVQAVQVAEVVKAVHQAAALALVVVPVAPLRKKRSNPSAVAAANTFVAGEPFVASA